MLFHHCRTYESSKETLLKVLELEKEPLPWQMELLSQACMIKILFLGH